MMTYIEFFDKTHTENMCACLCRTPERVVLIGKDKKDMEESAQRYSQILSQRGQKTEFVTKGISRNGLSGIVALFEELISTYDNCVFDLTGGEELFLTGAGIIFERYPDKGIELVRFNIPSGKVYDCDNNGIPEFSPFPEISAEENILAYGGRITWGEGATHRWDNTVTLFEDIDKLWDICKRDVKRWNSLVTVLEAADKTGGRGLDSDTDMNMLSVYTEKLVTKKNFDIETLNMLLDASLIESWEFNGSKFRITHKNTDVKRCLTKAGQVLEMKMYSMAVRACEEGNRFYNDVLTGVCIDWDGEKTGIDTENEIDVMMMRGLCPVFVSCKNGYVEIDELYKLQTVSRRFGGKYARSVLVASALDLDSGFGKILKARAEDMGIRVLGSEVVGMSDIDLEKKIKSFCK